MKAAQITGYGGTEVVTMVDDAAMPEIDADQVLVEVYAAAVNPFDNKVRSGLMKDSLLLELPAILGGDLAGVVFKVGDDVVGFKPGDEVFGQANAAGGHGSFAEYAPVAANSLALKPVGLDFVSSAALPLAAVSAYQALVEHGGLKQGQKVLIHGGAGGIGSLAIQLAKYIGAYVATTASAEDKNYVIKLGADEVIDYESQSFESMLSGYDLVYDTIGGDTFIRSYQVLKPGGIIVSMVAQEDPALSKTHTVKVVSQFTRVTNERLTKIADLIDHTALKVQIDKVFDLDHTGEAMAYLESGKHRGKVVIKIK